MRFCMPLQTRISVPWAGCLSQAGAEALAREELTWANGTFVELLNLTERDRQRAIELCETLVSPDPIAIVCIPPLPYRHLSEVRSLIGGYFIPQEKRWMDWTSIAFRFGLRGVTRGREMTGWNSNYRQTVTIPSPHHAYSQIATRKLFCSAFHHRLCPRSAQADYRDRD